MLIGHQMKPPDDRAAHDLRSPEKSFLLSNDNRMPLLEDLFHSKQTIIHNLNRVFTYRGKSSSLIQ
jgi:hypothetical protein